MAVTLPDPATVPNRTLGKVPLAVFFDARATLSTVFTTSTKVLRYVDFRWSFGDPSSGTWTYSGKSKNIAKGAFASHIYKAAGTYTWYLWARDGYAGSAVRISGTITVSDFSDANTICYNPIGDSDFSWVPSYSVTSANHKNGSFSTAFADLAANKAVFLKPGVSWSMGSGTFQVPNSGPWAFGGYGGQAILTSSSTARPIELPAGTLDGRVLNLDITGPSGGHCTDGAISSSHSSFAVNRCLIMGVTQHNFPACVTYYYENGDHDENFIIECDASGWGGDGVNNNNGNGFYLGGKRFAVMGCKSTDALLNGEHCCRLWHGRGFLIQHCSFARPNEANGKHCLKFHNEAGTSIPITLPTADGIIASDNTYEGGSDMVWFGPQDDSTTEFLQNIVSERNKYKATSFTQKQLRISAIQVTARNEQFFGTGSEIYYTCFDVSKRAGETAPTDIDLINASACKTDNCSEAHLIRATAACSNVRIKNSVFIFSGTASSAHGIIDTDNGGSATPITLTNVIERSVTTDVVNPANDLHLQAGASTLRDAGVDAEVFDDYEFLKRPQNSVVDIGAYEYSNGESWDFPEDGGGSPPVNSESLVRGIVLCS